MDFDHVFDTPYDRHDSLNGKKCRIVRVIQQPNSNGTSSDVYRVMFEDGIEVGVWPEEIREVEE